MEPAHYSGLLRQYGACSEGVGFSERSHRARLQAILRAAGDLTGATILDLGCGYGAFLQFLIKQGVRPGQYVGVDFTPAMLEAAREYRSPVPAEWVQGDLFQRAETLSRFDIVVANGILNREVPDVRGLTEKLIGLVWRHASQVGIVTMLTTLAPSRKPGAYYHKPETLVRAMVECGCQCFTLDHSYLPHDAMLVMRRRGAWE